MLLFLSASPHQPARRRERRQDRPAKSGKRARDPPAVPALAFRTGPGPLLRLHHIFPKTRLPDRPFPAPASGKPDLYGQARERAKEILATHKQKNPLSPEQVKAIRDVLVDAEGELGVADFWKGKEEKRFIDNDLY